MPWNGCHFVAVGARNGLGDYFQPFDHFQQRFRIILLIQS
jgi:hypothetical protein